MTSLFAAGLSVMTDSERSRRFGQRLIHKLFAFFVWYVRSCGLLRFESAELESLRGERGIVIAANHPSLLDAVFIAGCLPNVFCLMKASLVQNVVLCGQAKLAGYVNNKSSAGLIKSCQARLREGSNLLVFPEGTRTRPGDRLGDFKMGFALVAKCSQRPVQTLLVNYDQWFLGKEWPFFRPPLFPLHCTVTLGRRFEPSEVAKAADLGREIEAHMREALAGASTEKQETVCQGSAIPA